MRAWWELEQAFAAFNAELHRDYDVTGGQLALLRIIAERQPVTIRELRRELDWHPASLGQLVQRLVDRGLVVRTRDAADRRVRTLSLSRSGQELLAKTPLVGPVRLRQVELPTDDLAIMRRGFEVAIKAFALTPWSLSLIHISEPTRPY